jgi:hypothetical protein
MGEPGYTTTYDQVISWVQGFIDKKTGVILLEHDLRAETVQAGQAISQMVAQQGGRINVPLSAVFGESQRYQGSNLVWPVVSSSGTFDGTQSPLGGNSTTSNVSRMRDEGIPECSSGATCPTATAAASK